MLAPRQSQTNRAYATIKSIDYGTLHRRLLHCSHERILLVAKEMGIVFKATDYRDFVCHICHEAKEKQQVSRAPIAPAQAPLHEIHMDTIHHSNLGIYNLRYSTHFLDAFSGYHWIIFARSLADIAAKVITWGTELQNLTELSIHEFYMDGGKEFLQTLNWAAKQGIQVRTTSADTPEPRGRIERAGALITTMARCAIIDARLPEFLWPYAEAWAIRILNLLPAKANGMVSPQAKLASTLRLHKSVSVPFYHHIRIFGSIAWLLLKGPKAPAKGQKMAPRAIKGRYLGAASQHGHVIYVYIPSKHQVARARDVSVIEEFDSDESTDFQDEYIAQFQDNSDSDNDEEHITSHLISHITEPSTEITVQDSAIEQLEMESDLPAFITPPISPQAQRTQPRGIATQVEAQPDLQSFLNQLQDTDIDDLNSEQPCTTPPRRTARSTAQHDYKVLSSGKSRSKPRSTKTKPDDHTSTSDVIETLPANQATLAMVTAESERQFLPPTLAFSSLKALDFQSRALKTY